MANTASSTALNTTEILEYIMLSLPLDDLLLRASLVSHFWQNTLTGSPHLQRALFFQPFPNITLQYFSRGTTSTKTPHWATSTTDPNFYTPYENPFYAFFYNNENQRLVLTKKTYEAAMRPEASWMRMLISQPAIVSTGKKVDVRDLGGVRMGLEGMRHMEFPPHFGPPSLVVLQVPQGHLLWKRGGVEVLAGEVKVLKNLKPRWEGNRFVEWQREKVGG